MVVRRFPFISFDAGGPMRPLVPFDFPKGKNVYCLVDSGASASLMSASFMRHEEMEYERTFSECYSEGICGNECLQILGITKPAEIRIVGLPKAIKLEFTVVPDRYKVNTPIFGQNLFEHMNVGFGKEGEKLFAIIKE